MALALEAQRDLTSWHTRKIQEWRNGLLCAMDTGRVTSPAQDQSRSSVISRKRPPPHGGPGIWFHRVNTACSYIAIGECISRGREQSPTAGAADESRCRAWTRAEPGSFQSSVYPLVHEIMPISANQRMDRDGDDNLNIQGNVSTSAMKPTTAAE